VLNEENPNESGDAVVDHPPRPNGVCFFGWRACESESFRCIASGWYQLLTTLAEENPSLTSRIGLLSLAAAGQQHISDLQAIRL